MVKIWRFVITYDSGRCLGSRAEPSGYTDGGLAICVVCADLFHVYKDKTVWVHNRRSAVAK